MIFLRNNDLFQTVGVLESFDSIGFEERDRNVMKDYPGARIRGAYSYLGGRKLLAVIREGDDLYLRIYDNTIHWDEIVSVSLKDIPGGQRHLAIDTKIKQFTIDYDRPRIDPPISPIHEPFSDEEDYDFGLFIKHLADDPARRERAFRTDSWW